MIKDTVGPYEIIEKLGQGGMGSVYKAVHSKINQVVAIKILHPSLSENDKMQERFIKEASIQATFSHPNIVDVLNYLEDENNKFLVLEYIDGTTLEEKLRKSGSLSIQESVSISKQVLSALEFLHSRGVVHRDIKPSNIMFDQNGAVKVTDFGTAKILGDIKKTKTGLIGSHAYMSPEQILGEEVTAVSDIYSFGITLYRMVTGWLPFEDESEYKVMKGHLEHKPRPPWEVNDEVPKSLGNLILKSLSKKPEGRFRSVKEFSEALNKIDFDNSPQKEFRFSVNYAALTAGVISLILISYLLIFPYSGSKNTVSEINKGIDSSFFSVHAEDTGGEITVDDLAGVTEDQAPEIADKKEEVKPVRKKRKVKKAPPSQKKTVIPPRQDKKWKIRK